MYKYTYIYSRSPSLTPQVKVDAASDEQITALIAAAGEGHGEIVEFLLTEGKVRERDMEGMCVFIYIYVFFSW